MADIFIDRADKDPKLPEFGKGKVCDDSECTKQMWESGYGLAGGGMGIYSYCQICEKIVEKTVEES